MAIQNKKGYRGNALLKKVNTPIDWTPELILEFKKCSKDPVYFSKKYVKIVNVDKGLMTIDLYQYQKKIIRSIWMNSSTIVTTARQAGKFLFLDKELPLFNGGFTTMGNVKVGDVLIDADGKPTTVTFKSDIINRKCYQITFDDGTTCDAGDDHQWEVVDRFKKHKREVLTTQQMFDIGWSKVNKFTGYNQYRWYIPNTKPVEYHRSNLPIDPYILGIWLGNGTPTTRELTCDINDVDHYQKQGVKFGKRTVYKDRPNLFTAVIDNISPEDFKKYNLENNKHIPDPYLYGSIEQRVSLVQGLWDTDGFIEKKDGRCSIQLSTVNMQLVDNIQQLLCSLGLKVFRSNHTDKKFNKTSVKLSFTCGKDFIQVSRIKRKNSRQREVCKNSRYSLSRTIQDIKEVPSKPSQCISVDNERRLYLCGKEYLPTHNTTSVVCYVLWYVLFHSNVNVGILANKGETAREILSRVKLAYQYLPQWLQQGTVRWNEGDILLENGSRVLAEATSKDALRGYTINLLVCDEAAHVENWEEFFTSVYPTISSGKTTKIVLISTPNGLNHFYATWENAHKKGDEWNGYNPISVMWYDVPGRDENWKKKTLQSLNFDEQKFLQEYCNEFLGSSGTLISGWKLKELVSKNPILDRDGLKQYEEPKDKHVYTITVDVSEGKSLDYSTFHVIDVTSMPYKSVCTFHSNLINAPDFASILYRIAKLYNSAFILIELASLGPQIADIIYDGYEYENVLFTTNAGAKGKRIGFVGTNVDRGIKMSTAVKSVGCSLLKLLIEQNQLIINDFVTISELSTFSKNGKSYEAEEGKHDDMVMALVVFAWLTGQNYFKEITDIDTLHKLKEKTEQEIKDDLLPFGLKDDGSDMLIDMESPVYDINSDDYHGSF